MSDRRARPGTTPICDLRTSSGTLRLSGAGSDVVATHPDGRTACSLPPSAMAALAAFTLGVVCGLEGEGGETVLHGSGDGGTLTAVAGPHGQDVELTWTSPFRDDAPRAEVDARSLGSAVAHAIASRPPDYGRLDDAPSSGDVPRGEGTSSR